MRPRSRHSGSAHRQAPARQTIPARLPALPARPGGRQPLDHRQGGYRPAGHRRQSLALVEIDVGAHSPLVIEQRSGVGPALVDFPYQIACRHHDIVEEYLANMGLAVDLGNAPNRDAIALQIDEQERDACLRLHSGIRADQKEAPFGFESPTRPYLLAVDPELVAFSHGTRLQAREVGPRPWLGKALAPDILSPPDSWQEAILLLVGAQF